MEKFKDILDQNPTFIKSFTLYDFRRNMGQLAIEIEYTSGDTQMLTTPSTKDNVSDKGDLSVEDYHFLVEELQKLKSN
ncbi:hypothetical protein T190115A13A_270045 [Tenacibaculum sp. 190524A02b]|uniref:Uncharacterized protein n=1 Tax=Tenacibaculum vairaonense TaxID=3137860 RepID=A0ABP1FBD7_9FLAO